MPSYRSNVAHKSSEAVTLIIGSGSCDPLPREPICCVLDADCAQTARISLRFHQCQRARTQKPQNRHTRGASCNLTSRDFVSPQPRGFSSLPFPPSDPRFLPLSLPFASFRRPFRFGEAVSRPHSQNPQEPFFQKDHKSFARPSESQENKAGTPSFFSHEQGVVEG